MTTRRTHVVRIHDTVNNNGTFVDVEVLDAIAFRGPRGEELVLNCPTKNAVPFIVDDTGGGSGTSPSAQSATRRTHMKKIKGDASNFFNVEILDCLAFRGQNGDEWIYNAPAEQSVPYNVTDGGGGGGATRRTHTEKIGNAGPAKGGDYIKIERTDMMSFRSINGKELIVEMPSADDGSIDRADTTMDPEDYDATKNTPVPPDNNDPHVYVKFLKNGGVVTKDTLIAQGPFWWIRKIGSSAIIFVEVVYQLRNNSDVLPAAPTITLGGVPYGNGFDIRTKVDKLLPGVQNPVAVVNPVTDKMLETFYQWTPTPLKEVTATGEGTPVTGIYYVDGSNFEEMGGGLVSPIPTKDNFALQGYLRPGGAPPETILDFNPDPTNEDYATGNTILEWRSPITNPTDVPHPEALPDVSGDNKYLTAAAAALAASEINNWQASIGFPLGFDIQPAFAAGPLSETAPTPGVSVRNGTAVFAINYGQLAAAWAAQDPKAPVTFTITAKLQGADEESLNVGAEGYTKLRDFKLDPDTLAVKFKPWDPAEGDNLVGDGVLMGTIVKDPSDPTLFKVTFKNVTPP